MSEIILGKRKKRIQNYLGSFFRILLVIAFILIFWFGIDRISRGNIARQKQSLYDAIARDIVQCYSLEGIYPPSLKYLEEHYGLVYDNDLFFIDYRPIASNIYPDVTILCLDYDAEEQDEER